MGIYRHGLLTNFVVNLIVVNMIGIAIVCMVNSTDNNNVHSHFRSSYLSSNFTNDTCLFKPTNGSSVTYKFKLYR